MGTKTLAAAAAGLAATLAACSIDKTVAVSDPGTLNPAQVNDPASLGIVRAGALADFQAAFDGPGNRGLVVLGGALGDELSYGGTDPLEALVDQRALNPLTLSPVVQGVYANVQRARRSAEQASAQYAALDSANTANRAQMLNLAGYAYLLTAEHFCSGIPFSSLNGSTVTYGQPQTTAQIFQTASAKFDSALAVAAAAGTSGAQQAALAQVGKGRAQLGLGNPAAAAAAVTGVPASFRYVVEHSNNTQGEYNAVYFWTAGASYYSVSDREGGNGLPYRSAMDPRTPSTKAGFTAGRSLTLYLQQKYTSNADPTVLASGTEAELIRAEAKLAAGDAAGFLTSINGLRAAGGLAPASDPGTPGGQVDLLFQERAYWLWLTGHRLGDLRRLARPAAAGGGQPAGYGRPVAQVFPAGTQGTGAAYGTSVSLPASVAEANNPNFSACDPSVP